MLSLRNRILNTICFLAGSFLLLSACGGGGDAHPAADENDSRTLDATLEKLGIDTRQSDRIDNSNKSLPANYSPLGTKTTLKKKQELLIAGLDIVSLGNDVNVMKLNGSGVSMQTESLLNQKPNTDWKESGLYDLANGDVDGDGIEEFVIYWWSQKDNGLRLRIIDNQLIDNKSTAFAGSFTSVLGTGTPSQLKVIVADFNGDGKDEIVLATVSDTAGKITVDFLNGSKNTTYASDPKRRKVFSAQQPNSILGVELAVGQIDLDGAMELGLVVNETGGLRPNGSPSGGNSNFYLYDDAINQYAELKSGTVSGKIDFTTYGGITSTIAMGDVDGDGLDEIVLAGLTEFSYDCESIKVIQYVLDDASASYANLGVKYETDRYPGSCESNSGWTTHIWANTLDIDGDQMDEIQINGFIYEDFSHAPTPWSRMLVNTGNSTALRKAEIPWTYLFKGNENYRDKIHRDNLVMTVGDVNQDGLEDIIVYSPGPVDIGDRSSGNSYYDINEYAVTIWGIDSASKRWGVQNLNGAYAGNIGLLGFIQAKSYGSPKLVTADLDQDSVLLKFVPDSHQLIFSEPLVHAVLAAPPCYNDGSQTADECRTAWGSATSSGNTRESANEISTNYHVGLTGGFESKLINISAEIEHSWGSSLRRSASRGYELTKSVTYTTGAMEDTVVATVVPYDAYSYEILSHPVDPTLVGHTVNVYLPRTPRTMQINLAFYNESMTNADDKIDARVFTHKIGLPSSYPTYTDALYRTEALRIGPKDVGLSSGSQTLAISESRTAGFTTTMAFNEETTIKATLGIVMGGYTIGSSHENSFTMSMGKEVVYSGTVGDLKPSNGADRNYRFGMFVYKQSLPSNSRPFQVINYWVE